MSTSAHNLDSIVLDKIRDLLASPQRWDMDMINSIASMVALTGRATPTLRSFPSIEPQPGSRNVAIEDQINLPLNKGWRIPHHLHEPIHEPIKILMVSEPEPKGTP